MDDQKNEQQYIKGYNDGYLLSRLEPDALKKLSEITPKGNPYFDGLNSGRIAQEQERFAENLKKSREINEQPKPHKGPRPK